MAADPIHQARRAAKALSRTSDIGYQQALDVVAREAGHGTWSAMTAAHATGDAVQLVKTDTETQETGWRIRTLERLEGSRHSAIDEAGIASIGKTLVGLADITRIPVLVLVAMLPLAAWPIAQGALGGSPGDGIFDIVLSMLPIILFGIATQRCPDHRGARRIRRTSRVLAVMFLLVFGSFMLSTRIIYGTAQTNPLSMASARLVLALAVFTIAMWTCAWEGRRRRRGGATVSFEAL
jgi:hypothetical protein